MSSLDDRRQHERDRHERDQQHERDQRLLSLVGVAIVLAVFLAISTMLACLGQL